MNKNSLWILIASFLIFSSCKQKQMPQSGIYFSNDYEAIEIKGDSLFYYQNIDDCYKLYSIKNLSKNSSEDIYIDLNCVSESTLNIVTKGSVVPFNKKLVFSQSWDSLKVVKFYNVDFDIVKAKLSILKNGKINVNNNTFILDQNEFTTLAQEIDVLDKNLIDSNWMVEEDGITSIRIVKFKDGNILFDESITDISSYFCGIKKLVNSHL